MEPDAQPAWNDPQLQVASDSARTARYRLHQSWYREHRVGVGPGKRHGTPGAVVGNTLDPEAVGRDRSLNFLNAAAHEAAERRAVEVQREGGTLEVGRLFHNLLSSMPMCFNIFGAIGEHPRFVEIVRALLDPDAAEVEEVICEIKPVSSLGDRTAFDAMVRYSTPDGSKRFVAIETKYTEPFSQRRDDKSIYRELTEASGWFVPGAADALVEKSTNQLWRGLLLASCTERDLGMKARYAVVCPSDDPAKHVIAAMQRQMTQPGRLTLVTLDAIADCAAGLGDDELTDWSTRFRERYVDLQQGAVARPAAVSVDSSARPDDPGATTRAEQSSSQGGATTIEPRDIETIEAMRHRINGLDPEFHTKDVSRDDGVRTAFADRADSRNYHAIVGRTISKYRSELALEMLDQRHAQDGQRWRRLSPTSGPALLDNGDPAIEVPVDRQEPVPATEERGLKGRFSLLRRFRSR